VACPALNIFPHDLINSTISGKKGYWTKMCVLAAMTKLTVALRNFAIAPTKNRL